MNQAIEIPKTHLEIEEAKVQELKDKFTPEFIVTHYKNDPTMRAIFHALFNGNIGPWAIIELLIEDRMTLTNQFKHLHMYHCLPHFIKYPECEDKKLCPTNV